MMLSYGRHIWDETDVPGLSISHRTKAAGGMAITTPIRATITSVERAILGHENVNVIEMTVDYECV